MSGLFVSPDHITPLVNEAVEQYFDYAAAYRTAERNLMTIGEVEFDNLFEDPHLKVVVNGKEEHAVVIRFGNDALVCFIILTDEDRLYFLVEATDDPSGEDGTVPVRTWHTRPNALFGSEVGDQHIATTAALANLAHRLVELNPDV